MVKGILKMATQWLDAVKPTGSIVIESKPPVNHYSNGIAKTSKAEFDESFNELDSMVPEGWKVIDQ